MKKIFIDVSPGFYKTNLFNELVKSIEIYVIYTTDYNKSSRNNDFLLGERNYPYVCLKGSKIKQAIQVYNILNNSTFDEVIVGGYTSIPSWIPILFAKSKNSLILESTFRETNTKGLRVWLKRLFFKHIDRVYACGSPHEKLAKMFGFKGECIKWYSVGLFNTIPQPYYEKRQIVQNFLFVGRFIPVKNLLWLIDRFANHKDLELQLIGFGELDSEIRNHIKTNNIKIIGAVNNSDLPSYYQRADVFILPSLSETWGLVVEEALNNGTPVMLSHMVGSADDLVIENKSGVIFKSNNEKDFEKKLEEITNINKYNSMRYYISTLNFEQRKIDIVNSFIK